MKIYLDTDALSEIVRRERLSEIPALDEIVQRWRAREFSLVTSRATSEEVARCSGTHGPDIQSLCESIDKIPYVEKEAHVGFNSHWDSDGGWCSPRYDVDLRLQALQRLGLKEADAHHVMLALADSCEVFVTCDRKTILSHRKEVESTHSIRLLLPSEFVSLHPR